MMTAMYSRMTAVAVIQQTKNLKHILILPLNTGFHDESDSNPGNRGSTTVIRRRDVYALVFLHSAVHMYVCTGTYHHIESHFQNSPHSAHILNDSNCCQHAVHCCHCCHRHPARLGARCSRPDRSQDPT
jgi:hypothetical protein